MNRRVNGFTLIELMIAMAVFAIAGVAVMRATTEHIRAMGMIEEMTMAGYVAENQLQLARLETRWPPQPREGEAEMAKNRWKWVLSDLRKKGKPSDKAAGLEFFRRMFAYIARCDLLMGKKGDWSCTLPWIVEAENFAKVIEGNYEPKEAA